VLEILKIRVGRTPDTEAKNWICLHSSPASAKWMKSLILHYPSLSSGPIALTWKLGSFIISSCVRRQNWDLVQDRNLLWSSFQPRF